MLLEPIYAENIIVAVVYNQRWQWYVTEKDLWFLDYTKLKKAYLDKGFEIVDEIYQNERRGIDVLDSQTVDIFFKNIKEYLTTKEELNHLLKDKMENGDSCDDLLDFSPTLYVDFDNKEFYSMFPEPASFEEYVPEGWNGKYLDFTNLIPEKEKYWLDDFNENIFIKYQ